MKKPVFLMIITLLVIGTTFAQNQERERTRERRSPPESITDEGTLQLQNGIIAVKSGETVYSVPQLQRYIGFIEGLKEGKTISIEGYALKNFLRPVKVTLDGKTYDFPAIGFEQRRAPMAEHGRGSAPKPMFGQGPWHRMAPGRRR